MTQLPIYHTHFFPEQLPKLKWWERFLFLFVKKKEISDKTFKWETKIVYKELFGKFLIVEFHIKPPVFYYLHTGIDLTKTKRK